MQSEVATNSETSGSTRGGRGRSTANNRGRGGFRGKRGQNSRGRGHSSYRGGSHHIDNNRHHSNTNLPTLKREKNTLQQRLEDELLPIDSESDSTPIGSVNSDSFEEVLN